MRSGKNDQHTGIKKCIKTLSRFLFKNINFSLEKGYIMGFIGPNGAGKSTTIKLIMNLIKKTKETSPFSVSTMKSTISKSSRGSALYTMKIIFTKN